MIGPSLGGLLYGLGRGVPFLADAVSYVLSVIALLPLRADVRPITQADAPVPHLGREIKEGLRWLYAHADHSIRRRLDRRSDGLPAPVGFLILIVLAQSFGAGPTAIGFLFATGGVGGILGSLLGGSAAKAGSLRAADDRRSLGLGRDLAAVRAGPELDRAGDR